METAPQYQAQRLRLPSRPDQGGSSSSTSSLPKSAGARVNVPTDNGADRQSGDSGEGGFQELNVDDGRDGQEEELTKGLDERHVNMIAFSSVVGIGLFLQVGKVIYLAGPGLAIFAYLLMGMAMWSAIASLGEMTALFPVKGSIFEFPGRFLDEGVGYAVGWMSWFTYVVIIAAEVTAVAQLFKFQFDPNYLRSVNYPRDTLEWTSTQNVNPAIFVALFLVFILVINMLRVRWYGEIEYWFGCAKMVFIVGLIMFNITNNARTSTGFKYYNSPWGFQSRNFTTVHNGTQTIHTGGSAHLAAMWTAMTTTIFSMIGFETVAITAPENRLLREKETIKLASRKISLRIILLYTLSAFAVGLNVPYDDSYLRDLAINSLKTGEHSAFIIAAVRDHVLGFPHFFNGFFIFSATSAGLNALYVSSRLLHALAVCPDVWPRWGSVESLRTRLAHTYSGVPRGAVFASWLFGLLAFLAIKPEPAVILGRMATNSTVSMMIVYSIICASYLRFYQCIKRARGGNARLTSHGQNPDHFNRSRPLYPFKSHGQWLRALYGMLTCGLMAFFNGWRSVSPISGWDFVASYISVIVFVLLVIAYHIKLEGIDPRNWKIRASEDLRNPLVADLLEGEVRRGKLRRARHDVFFCKENAQSVWEWIVVWFK